MSSKRHLILALAASMVVLAIGFGLLVWPALSRTTEVTADIADLDHKNKTLEERTALIGRLVEELDSAKDRAKNTLKRIPNSPEIAELIRQLSMPVDGYFVADQTFTAGRSKEASPDEDVTARAVPLTVDVVARYDAVLELIRRAESSDRLVRVASVRVRRHPDKSNIESDNDAMLIASITLEAVFDPSATGSGLP